MKQLFFLFFFLYFSFLSFSIQANESWDALIPKINQADDPFKELTRAQLNDLGYYVGLKKDIERTLGTVPQEKTNKKKAELKTLHQELSAQNIDIAYLLSSRTRIMQQREQQAKTPNKALINQPIKIKGFILPFQKDGQLNTQFFMVEQSPFISIAHNHQAPAPNQAIYISYPLGKTINYNKPVTITGTCLLYTSPSPRD